MSKAMDKIDAAVTENTGCISAVFGVLCEAGSRLKSVTRFISKDLRVRISRRRGCPSDFSVSVGKPNYRERVYVKRYVGAVQIRGLTMTTVEPIRRKKHTGKTRGAQEFMGLDIGMFGGKTVRVNPSDRKRSKR